MRARAPLALVVAIGPGNVIGKAGGLPWRIPEDLRHFKAVTWGHAIIMGKKTYASIGKPLPGRRNIVLSRDRSLVIEGCEVAPSLDAAISLARLSDAEPRVIGGASVYAEALPLATTLYLTEVAEDVTGDTFFPPFDAAAFREAERRSAETPGVTFVRFERREDCSAGRAPGPA